jgi:hypothetical protein
MKGGKVTKLLALAAVLAAAALAVTAGMAAAAPPLHDHFVSDPYPDNWCGIGGTSVDRVVANYTADESRTSLNVTTTFTANTGKVMEIRTTGSQRRSAPIDNGDGTYSYIITNAGQSPVFKIPGGPPIGLDVGLVQFRITRDAATDDFVSFEVVKVAGQRPALDDQICAYLLDP